MNIYSYYEFLKEAGGGNYLPVFTMDGPTSVSKHFPRTAYDRNISHVDSEYSPENILLYSNLLDKYFDHYQIQELLLQYKTYCRGNNEEIIVNSINNTSELDFILKKIH
jgi:hypothetical protein